MPARGDRLSLPDAAERSGRVFTPEQLQACSVFSLGAAGRDGNGLAIRILDAGPARAPWNADQWRRRRPREPSHLVFDVFGRVAHRATGGGHVLAHAFDGIAGTEDQRHEEQRGKPEQPAELAPVGPR